MSAPVSDDPVYPTSRRRRSSRASTSAWVLVIVALVLEIGAVIFGTLLSTGEGWSGLAVVVLPLLAGVIAAPLVLIALIVSAVACFGDGGNPRRVRPWGAFIVSLAIVLYALSVIANIVPVLGFL